MRRSLTLVLLACAACSRSWSAPNDVPRIDSLDPAVARFAGQTLVIHGSGFSAADTDDVVRFGTTQAQVLADADAGSPAPSLLEVVVPDLGPTAQDVELNVSVSGGVSSRPVPFHYRGPGHPHGLSIALGQDFSPTPTSISAFGGLLAATLLRNNVTAVYMPGINSAVALPAWPGHLATDSRLLPGASPPAVLWDLEFAPFAQPAATVMVRSTFGQADTYALAQVTPGLPATNVQSSGLPVFSGALPTIYGLDVLEGLDGLDPRNPALLTTPVPGVISAADDLLTGDGGLLASELAALSIGDGGELSVTQVEIVAGEAPVTRSAKIGARPLPQLIAYSASPDGGTLIFADVTPESTSLGTIDVASGSASDFVTPLPFPANAIAANQQYFAVSSQLTREVEILRVADGSFVGSVALGSSPFALTKDELPPNHFYAAQLSPPAAVEIDPEAPRIVRSLSLANGIAVSSASPDGTSLVVGCRQIPCLAVVDTRSLHEGDGGFQHAAEAPGFDFSYVASTAWLEADGGYELCGSLAQIDPDGGVITAHADGTGRFRDVDVSVRCGPPDAFFSASKDVVPHVLGAQTDPDVPALFALDGGTLRLFYRDHVVDCANGSCIPQGDFTAEAGASSLAFTPEGNALRIVSRGLEELEVGAGQVTPTILAGPPQIESGGTNHVVVDSQGNHAVVVQHGTLVFDLRASPPAPVALAFYLSDEPVSAAFSPDGQRLYVGTALGHLDEYDLSALPPPQGGLFPPTLSILRSVVAGFPILQITPSLDGSRLVLTDLSSDRLFVAE